MKALLLRSCAISALFLLGQPIGEAPAGEKLPVKLRINGPSTLIRGTRQLIYVEGLYGNKDWKPVPPDQFRVQVKGAARILEDPAGKPMNPLTIDCADVEGKATIEIGSAGKTVTRVFPVRAVKPAALFEAAIDPAAVAQRFSGLGGGVLFYDNQFDISKSGDIYDWCFKDVRTTFLHVLIRPNCLPADPNEDWRKVDLGKFDFAPLERPFRIIKKALERNRDLKIYASLFSPPAWLKTNNDTKGRGSLKDGLRYRQELARYVYAYLKHARRHGITVDYLSFFNEPEFPHTQEGMHFPDLGALADTFDECARALDTLIAADPDLKQAPVYIFPDTLGPGAITRAGPNSQKLRDRAKRLGRVGIWGVHDYWNQAGTYWPNRFRELRAFPGVGKKPLWVTEWSQGERWGDLASGVEYGTHILNALRLGAEAWMMFEWCHPSGNQAGLISTDWTAQAEGKRYWRSKAYHVFRQIANTTPAGAQVISMTGRFKGLSQATGKGVEYLALRDGNKIIVHLMNAEPTPVSYRLTLPRKIDTAAAWTTTPREDVAGPDAKKPAITVRGNISTAAGVIEGLSLLSCVLETKGK